MNLIYTAVRRSGKKPKIGTLGTLMCARTDEIEMECGTFAVL